MIGIFLSCIIMSVSLLRMGIAALLTDYRPRMHSLGCFTYGSALMTGHRAVLYYGSDGVQAYVLWESNRVNLHTYQPLSLCRTRMQRVLLALW